MFFEIAQQNFSNDCSAVRKFPQRRGESLGMCFSVSAYSVLIVKSPEICRGVERLSIPERRRKFQFLNKKLTCFGNYGTIVHSSKETVIFLRHGRKVLKIFRIFLLIKEILVEIAIGKLYFST